MNEITTATRYHDFSAGHRVVGHEGKCRYLHGHNYRVFFVCRADELDEVGRVIDFSVIKARLCYWLEECWDHKMLLWDNDPLRILLASNPTAWEGVTLVPFNPTAENLAKYLVSTIGPVQLQGTGVELVSCTVWETRKCAACYSKHEDSLFVDNISSTKVKVKL